MPRRRLADSILFKRVRGIQIRRVAPPYSRAEAVLMSTVRKHADGPLAGQVAVVTGAGRGIGAAIARDLSSLGAIAVLCGRTRAALESSAEAISQAGGKAEVIVCD